MAQKSSQLPSKEATLFRHLVQNYEAKQYKKGLKAAEQILRKHPNHGDTQAMKALILNSQGKNEEAFELCKLSLKNAMKSNVCWHVYGLLYKSVKNYEESIKAYRYALKLDQDSVQILRDMAQLQVQMRDYQGMVQTRRSLLTGKPQVRLNWTALAVALHLSGDLEGAENVLHKYEETLKQSPPKSDMEHSEAILYKNTIIAESGKLEKALEHAESIERIVLDRTAVMELKANYLLRLKKREEAEKAYRALLERNAEKREHYEGLEKALALDRQKSDDHAKLLEMYDGYAAKSDRIDAARRMPLDFLTGDAFQQHAEKYLRRMFSKGVPSTFSNLKQLYQDETKKQTLLQLAEKMLAEEPPSHAAGEKEEANGSIDATAAHAPKKTDPATSWQLSINYYLAQHYDYYKSRDLAKAQQYIDKAISLNPSKTDYAFQMTRARILKHLGATDKASTTMNGAREMDLRDRYINTKCAKYQLRNDQNEDAVSTMGLFTRKEAVGGPLGDLTDMQCVWFLTEDGESYLRQGRYSIALKRFKTIYDIFEQWTDDQFDFHHFSLRKGMIRAYVDMVRWEDRLQQDPLFTRAALSVVRIYILMHDDPEVVQKSHVNGSAGQSSTEKKKAAKKAKKEAEKAAAEAKSKNAKQPPPKADDEDTKKKEDPDPNGLELIKTEKPLEEAMRFVTPLLELTPKNVEAQVAGFEVFIRRRKYLPALKCLLALYSIDPNHPKCHELGGRFKLSLDNLSEPLPEKIQPIIKDCYLSKLSSKSLEECNEEYLAEHKDSAPHVLSVVRFRNVLSPKTDDTRQRGIRDLTGMLEVDSVALKDVEEGLRLLGEMGIQDPAQRDKYLDGARRRWPEAAVLKEEQ